MSKFDKEIFLQTTPKVIINPASYENLGLARALIHKHRNIQAVTDCRNPQTSPGWETVSHHRLHLTVQAPDPHQVEMRQPSLPS